MHAKRLLKHLVTTKGQMNAAFSAGTLHDIEAAIESSEAEHAGELRFVVETALEPIALIRGASPRTRAVELFSILRVWDTEHNCGLLIYVLLADRAVEIVADRGIHAKVGEAEWTRICHQIEEAFRQKDFRGGAIGGIESVTQHLKTHFSARIGDQNELPDRPVVLG